MDIQRGRTNSQVAERIVRLETKVERLEREVQENFDDLNAKIDRQSAELKDKMDDHLAEHKWLTRLLLGTLASAMAALALQLLQNFLK